MKVKCNPNGEILTLDGGPQIGAGGEGGIYRLADRPDLAAKIYHPGKMNPERVGKLRAMLANAPADPTRGQRHRHASIAWPVALLESVDTGGQVIGFLMPLVQDAHPIHDFYNAGTRLSLFPQFSYDALCRTATNLASAVGAIHERSYVIGDINDSNIMVKTNALVTLVDTDSFQVTEQPGGRVYRCPVGTEMFTPPELRGKNFEEVNRSQEHDLFGIAVLFFQLLMEGTQPFAGVVRTPGEPTDYPECIARGYFPYGGHPLIAPSPLAPPFEALDPSLQSLFRQCFADGHADPRRRPDCATWHRALKESEERLTICRRNPQHYYFKHNVECPWCERAWKFQPNFAAAGVANWDPFPSFDRNAQAAPQQHSARPSSTVSRPLAPFSHAPVYAASTGASVGSSSFAASATTINIGQAVSLQWNIPYAQTVCVTDQSGRSIFAGNSASGTVTVCPTANTTYHLTASGASVRLPNPVVVQVSQVPRPPALKQPLLALHRPGQLRSVQVVLRSGLSLNQMSTRLSAWLKLKHYSTLGFYGRLRRVSVELKKHSPRPRAMHGYSNRYDEQSSSW